MDLTNMSRREKFRYLKAKGFKVKATMKNSELDKYLEMESPPEDQPSMRGERGKRRRTPLGRHRSKMSIEHLDLPKDKVPRWINDVGNRIKDALDGGYEFIRDPEVETGEDPMQVQGMGDAVNMKVGTKEDGSPQHAYLMVIDKELYEEDQKEKAAYLDEIDSAIQHGRHESNFDDGKYIPKSGINYNPKG